MMFDENATTLAPPPLRAQLNDDAMYAPPVPDVPVPYKFCPLPLPLYLQPADNIVRVSFQMALNMSFEEKRG